MLNRFSRLGWGFGDQALSSASNFVFALIVAREVSPSEFGAFGVAFSFYLLAIGGIRTFTVEPLVVVFSDADTGEQRLRVRHSSAAGTVVGVFVGVVVALLSLMILSTEVRSAVLPVALMLPLLVVQDLARFAFIMLGEPKKAFLNDLFWFVALVFAAASLLATENSSLASLSVAWATTGATAGALAYLQGLPSPDSRCAIEWYRTHGMLSRRYGTEFLATTAAWQVVLFGTGVIAGLGALGALRGAQVLFGPLHVVNRAATLVLVPEQIRRTGRRGPEVQAVGRTLAVSLGLMAALWAVVATLTPAAVGQTLLGATWSSAQDVVPLFGLFMVGLGVVAASSVALRILGTASQNARASVLSGMAQLISGLVGAQVNGAIGAATGLAVAGALSACVWWMAVRGAAKATNITSIMSTP